VHLVCFSLSSFCEFVWLIIAVLSKSFGERERERILDMLLLAVKASEISCERKNKYILVLNEYISITSVYKSRRRRKGKLSSFSRNSNNYIPYERFH